MNYQRATDQLALVRSNTESPTESTFEQQLQFLARRLLFSAVGIAAADRQFLHDLSRGEARFPMKTFRRLNAIAAHSTKPEDREGPAELMRADILTQTHRHLSLVAAFDAETEAVGPADVAQRRLERAITRATIDEASLTLTRQLVTTREALDAVRALSFAQAGR